MAIQKLWSCILNHDIHLHILFGRCDKDLINIKNYQCKLMLLMFLASAMTEQLYM